MENQKPGTDTSMGKSSKKLSQIVSLIGLRQGGPEEVRTGSMLEKLLIQMRKAKLDGLFVNLANYITNNETVIQKKHSQIQTGLYILVGGKICYVCTGRNPDLEKKQYMLNIAKSGILSPPLSSCADSREQETQSFAIDQPFSVFQCQFDNCMTLEDSILIRVDTQLRRLTHFDQMLLRREHLLQNCHLNGTSNQNEHLFAVNTKIHSSFRSYSYCFHSIIELSTIGIISQGVIQPRRFEKDKKNHFYQLQSPAVLLPGIIYEVVSTSATILVIENNPTLCYKHPELILAYRAHFAKTTGSIKFRPRQQDRACSLHLRRETAALNSKGSRRTKKLAQISRRYQNQLIISMHSCEQSLSFSEKQTRQLRRCNNKSKPNILFDYSKYSSIKSVNNFEGFYKRKPTLAQKKGEPKRAQERKTFNENLLRRYQNFSKELFLKFRSSQPTGKNQEKGGSFCQL